MTGFGTKGEERLMTLLDRQKVELDERLTSYTTGIFVVGVLTGVILCYTSLWGIMIGVLVGFCMAKQNFHLINSMWVRVCNILRDIPLCPKQ